MKKLKLGVVPIKRSFLPMEAAKAQKDEFMPVIRSIKSDYVEIIDVDELTENGIAEEGTHKELLAKGGIYAHLYEMQF